MDHDAPTERRARTEQRRATRTEAILDTAMRILAQEGEGALTMGRLAHLEGLVPAALYRYFPSKDAILVALQRRALEDLGARLTEARGAWETRLARHDVHVRSLGALLAVGRFYLNLRETAPETQGLLAILLGDPRPLLDASDASANAPLATALLGELAILFGEAARQGALTSGDALQRAVVYWASLQGLTQLEKLRRLSPALPSSQALGDLTMKTLLLGFGADPALLSRARFAL